MRVVHCKREKYTHYIGRPHPDIPRKEWELRLGNLFLVGPYTREKAIQEFEFWARQNPRMLETIRKLPEDAVLGCWCHPQPCHGDVIIKLWKEMHDAPEQR